MPTWILSAGDRAGRQAASTTAWTTRGRDITGNVASGVRGKHFSPGQEGTQIEGRQLVPRTIGKGNTERVTRSCLWGGMGFL